jgi:DNA polymerase IV
MKPSTVNGVRSVLFVDPPAFCTTLEELVAPGLRTRPLVIAPPAADRATILALSAEARRAGLKPGMPIRTALQLCRDLIVLPPNPTLYARASRELHEILQLFAPTIEPRGYGHAFLDLTGTGRLLGPPQDVAARIRREAQARLRLPLSVGIAANKLVSQAAIKAGRWEGSGSRHNEALPLVPWGGERDFLAPHPLDVLPELGPGIRARLDDYQLELIGEVAAISESALCAVFGGQGRTLRARARGIDPRPVLSPEQQSEFRVTHTFANDTNEHGILHPVLRLMSERLGSRLRRRTLIAGRLCLEATYADYTTVARAVRLKTAVLDGELWDAAKQAFALANTKRLAIRSLALTLDRLLEKEVQLELWGGMMVSGVGALWAGGKPLHSQEECSTRCPAALQQAVDRIRSRYGAGALGRGSPLTAYRSPVTAYQTTTILPKLALPSSTRCASAS